MSARQRPGAAAGASGPAPRPGPPADMGAFERFCAQLELDVGGPMRLEPFQRDMLADYFAGVIETLILLSKKNGKTTLLSALALFHLGSRYDAECVIGAASREQASILFRQAVGFVRRSPGLQQRIVVREGYRELRSRRPNDSGRIRVLAADADTADGVIPTLALVDELHRHKSTDLYGIFRDGLGPRGGRMVTISTAGEHESSPLGQMRAAARKLPGLERRGRYVHARAGDGSFALHEWALEETDDVDDLELVKLVNPLSSWTVESLAVRRDSPSTTPWQWARYACGIWIGSDAWWISGGEWQQAEATGIERELEPGERITVGFDGSRYHDATALVACRVEDALVVPLGVWEQPAGAREWEVPAGAVDAAVDAAFERYRVEALYCDPPLWQTEIDEWARRYGSAVQRFPTNRARMMGAVERFRTDLVAGAIRHAGDELLTRHVLNAHAREARGGYWLEKSRTGTAGNIDAAVAAVLAYEARCDVVAEGADRGEYAFL